MSKPWLKFYPGDWQSEVTLKRVSRAARSLWLDILCLIHQGGDGRLQFNGDNPTERDLSAVLGDDPRTIRKLIAELENAGVFSRDEQNFITSRRILRDNIKAEQDKNNGKLGGNPSLKNNDLDENGVNPEVKAQKLEARSQRLEKEKIPKEPRQAAPDAVLDEFSRIFWPAYPRKDAKAKAVLAFRKARKRVDLETIMEGLRRYVAGIRDPTYTLHATTWLNGERWADEPTPQIFQPSTNQLPFASNRQEPRNGNRIIDHLRNIGAHLEDLDSGCIPPARSSFAN